VQDTPFKYQMAQCSNIAPHQPTTTLQLFNSKPKADLNKINEQMSI